MAKQILVPLDGSPLAERALPYAVSLASASEARLVLVRAVEAHALTGRGRAKARVAAMAEAETYLDGIADPLRERGLTVDIALPYGGAADAIADEIAFRAIDLVVMATHGRGGLGRVVYGSVAERILHEAEVPVLLVRAWEERPGGSFDHAPCIVVPLDGSRFAEAALPVAREVATALGGHLLLVQAVEPPEAAGVPDLHYAQFDPEAELAAATDYLQRLQAEERAAGRTAEIVAHVGLPGALIPEVARSYRAALVVMATHGRSGLSRLVMGSVADATLRQGGTPLLLVRPPEAEASGTTATITVAAAR
jgi:nucleotide-binding universal stress UspA family protein